MEGASPLDLFKLEMPAQSHVEFYGFSLHLLCVLFTGIIATRSYLSHSYSLLRTLCTQSFPLLIPPQHRFQLSSLLVLSFHCHHLFHSSEWLSLGPSYVIVCVFCTFLFHYGLSLRHNQIDIVLHRGRGTSLSRRFVS